MYIASILTPGIEETESVRSFFSATGCVSTLVADGTSFEETGGFEVGGASGPTPLSCAEAVTEGGFVSA